VTTAELVLDEKPAEFRSVAAGLAVLAGIAAADAICCTRLHKLHRGTDHRQAVDLLRTALPSGRKEPSVLARLLDLKDEAHYGVYDVSQERARSAVQWSVQLLRAAAAALER
jgi:hypothetical protein